MYRLFNNEFSKYKNELGKDKIYPLIIKKFKDEGYDLEKKHQEYELYLTILDILLNKESLGSKKIKVLHTIAKICNIKIGVEIGEENIKGK